MKHWELNTLHNNTTIGLFCLQIAIDLRDGFGVMCYCYSDWYYTSIVVAYNLDNKFIFQINRGSFFANWSQHDTRVVDFNVCITLGLRDRLFGIDDTLAIDSFDS